MTHPARETCANDNRTTRQMYEDSLAQEQARLAAFEASRQKALSGIEACIAEFAKLAADSERRLAELRKGR